MCGEYRMRFSKIIHNIILLSLLFFETGLAKYEIREKVERIAQDYSNVFFELDIDEKERKEKREKVVSEYEDIIDTYPEYALTYIRLAQIYSMEKNYTTSNKLLKKVLNIEDGETAESLSFRADAYKIISYNYRSHAFVLLNEDDFMKINKLLIKSEETLERAIQEFKERLQQQTDLQQEIDKNIRLLKEFKEYNTSKAMEIKQEIGKKQFQERLLKEELENLAPEDREKAIEERLSKLRIALVSFARDSAWKEFPEELDDLVPEYLDFIPPGDWEYDSDILEIKSKSHPDL